MTTFHEALVSLQKSGPVTRCDDCTHFAGDHIGKVCELQRPGDAPCRCKGMKWQGQRFLMGATGPSADDVSVTCPQCNMTSYNPNDVEWGYCGNCHGYTGTVDPVMKAKNMLRGAR